jgi:hypothetical protein
MILWLDILLWWNGKVTVAVNLEACIWAPSLNLVGICNFLTECVLNFFGGGGNTFKMLTSISVHFFLIWSPLMMNFSFRSTRYDLCSFESIIMKKNSELSKWGVWIMKCSKLYWFLRWCRYRKGTYHFRWSDRLHRLKSVWGPKFWDKPLLLCEVWPEWFIFHSLRK